MAADGYTNPINMILRRTLPIPGSALLRRTTGVTDVAALSPLATPRCVGHVRVSYRTRQRSAADLRRREPRRPERAGLTSGLCRGMSCPGARSLLARDRSWSLTGPGMLGKGGRVLEHACDLLDA